MVAFAADPGAFSALCGEDVGIAGVGVAPAQVGLQPARQHGLVGVIGCAHGEGAQRPNLASIGFAQDAEVGVRHGSTLLRIAQARMAGVLFADRLSMIT